MATALHPVHHMPVEHSISEKAKVFYDGHCALCRKSVHLLRRLDWMERLSFVDVRELAHPPADGPPLSRERMLEEVHLMTPDGGRVYHGFEAFRWIAWEVPLLWVLVPFLYLPGMGSLGQKFYLWVARNRFRLIPCHGGVCALPAAEKL